MEEKKINSICERIGHGLMERFVLRRRSPLSLGKEGRCPEFWAELPTFAFKDYEIYLLRHSAFHTFLRTDSVENGCLNCHIFS